MFERRTEKKKQDLLSKPVWQVFISDQLVTALLKAHENWTQVSLSHILVINRQAQIYTEFYFILLEIKNESLIGRVSV